MKEQDKMQDASPKGLTGKVADTFVISGRSGVIATPAEAWAVPVKVGDTLRLVRPDGHSLTVQLAGFSMPSPPQFDRKNAVLLRAENLTKDDVPIGTEIWLD